MEDLVIEARINEYSLRDVNPNIPWTEDEIVANAVQVREKGAAILHYHARNADGSPNNGIETNARIIRKIRQNTDILIHVTLGFSSNDESPKERIANIVSLCSDPSSRPDIVPIDPGSTNIERYDRAARKVTNADVVYINSTETNMLSAEAFSKLGLTVQFFCWAVSHVRRGAMLMDLGLIRNQPYFVFHLTDGYNISSNLPTETSVRSLLEAMPANSKAPWAIACGGNNLFKIAPFVCRMGGHIDIGLGDYAYPELGNPTNAQLVEKTVQIAEENGRKIASLERAKEIFGIKK